MDKLIAIEHRNGYKFTEAMPRLRQPALLKDTAMEVLVDFFANFCSKHRNERSLDKLSQGTAFIKTKIGSHLPRNLAVVFYNALLEKFSSPSDLCGLSSISFLGIVLEVVRDQEIIGLTCTSEILASLHPEDFHRIQGFSELWLIKLVEPHSLEKLHLGNLTKFDYREFCTDSDLLRIGHHCPKLTYVNVSDSKKVTDAGLRALGLCSNLRSVSVSYCCGVSVAGLQNLLTVNVRISKIFGWKNAYDTGFNYFWDPDWASDISVHPSIESFTIKLHDICDSHLHFLVAKFPNLTSIKIVGYPTGDLCILKSLRRLSKVQFDNSFQISDKIASLLKCIGAQIKCLSIDELQSRDLNLIYELCRNLKLLRFGHFDIADPRVTLVIPPFQKLKYFICIGNAAGGILKLKFGQMLKLEILEIQGMMSRSSELKSVILNHKKFPSLKIMKISASGERNDFFHLSKLAQTCNLDFELYNW